MAVKQRACNYLTVGNLQVVGELQFKFNPEKAGQATAFLLKRSGGKRNKGHLVKMLYGSDWSQLRTSGVPITGAHPVSMPQGPVLSEVLDLINGKKRHPFWTKHFSQATQDNFLVTLKEDAPTDLLTESEKTALEKAHDFFAKKSWDEVKKFCHDFFKEWENPGSSQKPIDFEQMLLRSGKKSQKFVDELVSIQKEKQHLTQIFA